MTNAEVKKTLESVARRVLGNNAKLQKIADLQVELDELEDMIEVVGSRPALLQDLVRQFRDEYDRKLEEINDLMADAQVKKDLSNLRSIKSALGGLG